MFDLMLNHASWTAFRDICMHASLLSLLLIAFGMPLGRLRDDSVLLWRPEATKFQGSIDVLSNDASQLVIT